MSFNFSNTNIFFQLSAGIISKIKEYLLNVRNNPMWIEKFAPYSVQGFAEYDKNYYDVHEMKPVMTSGPYY